MISPLQLILFMILSSFTSFGQTDNSTCVTTTDLKYLNPEFISTPILFWKAKVNMEMGYGMVRLEDGRLLVNIIQCSGAYLRQFRPQEFSEDSQDGSGPLCEPIGDLWLPVAQLQEASQGEHSPPFQLDQPTEYFSHRVSHHLNLYARSMRWDPWIHRAVLNLDHAFLGFVGMGLTWISTKYMRPYTRKSRWGRFKRRVIQGFGLFLVFRQALLMYYQEPSAFESRMSQRTKKLEDLVSLINSRHALRMDGQDMARNLEEVDGYSLLQKAIKEANEDTFKKFCSSSNPME